MAKAHSWIMTRLGVKFRILRDEWTTGSQFYIGAASPALALSKARFFKH